MMYFILTELEGMAAKIFKRTELRSLFVVKYLVLRSPTFQTFMSVNVLQL